MPPKETESKPQEKTGTSQPSQAAGQSGAVKESKEAGKTETDRQTAPTEASGSESQQVDKQPPTGPESPQKSAAAGPQKAKDTAGAGRVPSPDTAEAKLAEARDNLRVSEQTEKRIASELEQLKKSGEASPEAVRDYEAYLKSVQAITAENRKILEKMERSYSARSPEDNTSSEPGDGKAGKVPAYEIPEAQTRDDVAALDRQLNASLNEFDEKLLREMDEIRAESAGKMQDLARDAAEAAKRLREKGMEAGSISESESAGQTDNRQPESESGRDSGSPDDTKGSDTVSGTGTGGAVKGTPGEDKRRAGYEDDDIVARQLREAAENETDPELKEKLWKEYEDYKKSL